MPAWGATPSIVDRDAGPCEKPLGNGLTAWKYVIEEDSFQGHQANILRSQLLIDCVIISFLFTLRILASNHALQCLDAYEVQRLLYNIVA